MFFSYLFCPARWWQNDDLAAVFCHEELYGKKVPLDDLSFILYFSICLLLILHVGPGQRVGEGWTNKRK